MLPPAFHISAEVLLAKAKAAGKQAGYNYLVTVGEGGAFVPDGPHWTGPWASSYAHVDTGFSTFLNNCVEASWFVDDVVNGDSRKDTIDKIFEKVKEKSVVWHFDGHLWAIQYLPNRVPNALLRGSVWEKKFVCVRMVSIA